MRLFGSKTDVDVRIDVDEVVAGGTVVAEAEFGEPDKRAQGARIELYYKNFYEETHADEDGSSTSRTRSDVIVASEKIALEGGLVGPVRVDLAVPPDAPGSAPDVIEWFVRATVDRRKARDASAQRPLKVLVPAAPLASWAESPPTTEGACLFDIDASSRIVRPGDRITGTLKVTAQKAISARSIRVQLFEKRFDPDANRTIDDSTRVELCGDTELQPGEEISLPFDIGVPAQADPSFRTEKNHFHWYLQGVVDLKRSSDPTVSLEIVVHTA